MNVGKQNVEWHRLNISTLPSVLCISSQSKKTTAIDPSPTMLSHKETFVIRESISHREYFNSEDDNDEAHKTKSLSFLDVSPSQEEFTSTKTRSIKKSISFGPVVGEEQERQRPVSRKTSKSSKAALETMPDLLEEFLEQQRPRRSTSDRRAKSSRSSPELMHDLEKGRQHRRPRRSTSDRRSKSSRQSPTSFGSRESQKKKEGRKGDRLRRSASMESKSSQASPESISNLQGEIDHNRQPRRCFSSKETPTLLNSHHGQRKDRPRRSKSMEYSKAIVEQKRSLTPEQLDPRRSRSRTFRKSPTPLEWHQQLQRRGDPIPEGPGLRRSLVKKSKAFRKSPEQESGFPKSMRSLGNKSESFRKTSTSQDPNQPTPLEWHQQLQQSEERQLERPRSRRSMSGKGSKSSRKSPTPLESRQHLQQEDHQEEHSEQRRRSMSGKGSKSSLKSPTPLESRQSQTHKEEEEEGLSRRRSLGRKSPTPMESRQTQKREEEEEERPSSRRLLGRKPTAFQRKSPTPLESRQHKLPGDTHQREEDEEHSGKKPISFRRKSPSARRSLTPDKPRTKRSMGRKLSLRNIFGNKSQQQQDSEVDWKGLGLKECSYYQIKNIDSSGSLKRKTSGSMKRLSSLTKLTRSRNSLKTERIEGEENKHNATWDHQEDGKGSQELTKTPGPLKNWSAFRRVPNTRHIKDVEEDIYGGGRKSHTEKGYEDVSLDGEPRS